MQNRCHDVCQFIYSGMKLARHFYRLAGVISFWLLVSGLRVEAQGLPGLQIQVAPSASALLVSNSLTYTINLTNLTGLNLVNILVSNALPSSVQITSYTATQGVATNYSGVIQFYLSSLVNGTAAQLTLNVEPTVAGLLTNTVTFSTVYGLGLTNFPVTNLVVQVTNAPPPQADLSVAITGPVQVVITNDWITYGVSVTNGGPASANASLTNTLPSGVLFLGVFPANPAPTIIASNYIFDLGTLASGAYTNLQFTIQPTNSGIVTLSASVGALGVLDTSLANNLVSTNLVVTNYSPGTLVAVTNFGQTINLQNGLTEQSIWLTNTGAASVAAARIVVTGVTNKLFNAVGTNNGNPFVYFSAPLNPGQNAGLRLQYSPRTLFPFTNGQLHAFPVPLPNWKPPKVLSTRTNINPTRIAKLAGGNMVVEFPATNGATYTIVYSDNVLFSNAQIAPPAMVAPANRVLWLDYGPPATVSLPTNTARFYRVFQNP